MPSYLEGPGIVYRLSETEVEVASHNVWAENVRNMLINQLQQYRMPDVNGPPNLSVHFERFNGSYTGNAELKGDWKLGVHSGDFDIKQPLDDEGYDALVQALNQGLDSLMQDIYSKVKTP
ncbi:PqiC family protein [Vibrio comitans]|nr:PqiC family protein [Vibrio comitans]